jgi:5-methylcytosine-specific restriction endonuclease McrA
MTVSKKVKRKRRRKTKGNCKYCDKPYYTKGVGSPEFDYKIPKSRGGLGHPDNIQIICQMCNRRKGTFTDQEWWLVLSGL